MPQMHKLLMPIVLLFLLLSNALFIKNTQQPIKRCPNGVLQILLDSVRSLKSETLFERGLRISFEMRLHNPAVVHGCWVHNDLSKDIHTKCFLKISEISIRISAEPSKISLTYRDFPFSIARTPPYEFNLTAISAEALVTITVAYWSAPRIQLEDLTFPDLHIVIFRSLQLQEYLSMPAWTTWAILEIDNFIRKAFAKLSPIACTI